MHKLSFDSFTKKIYIKASMKKLYWCWGTSEGITSWFLSDARYSTGKGIIRTPREYIQKGDLYTWRWHNWDDEEKGKVLQANGIDFIEFSFAEVTKVSVTLEDKGSSVLLTLRQYEIPTDEESKLNIHYGCSNGWTFWLANLKAYLEYGVLLNETEIDLRNVPLAGFEFVNM
ncbi:SRPBCC domain-containing protein [Flavobacteriaceae bacterium TP-CH-4]|uniref:SRPBCC domain-containing protein n=1 Tax=Pelagihabitans pacificus TaxID=2696054 RepID=A0A967ARV1_9FLAO|nr:SRPBCC domain-containing protein [Pelagihabitans pacificus]NHF57778.1 SRPBCC domain-containing protein [Pelagihabitans pacificus]